MRSGAKPGGRSAQVKTYLSPDEKKHFDQYCAKHNKMAALVIRESLIQSGALPPSTKVLDKRTEAKINRLLKS